mgnify:CR=1 FL=1
MNQNNYNTDFDFFKDKRITLLSDETYKDYRYLKFELLKDKDKEYLCSNCGSKELIGHGIKTRLIKEPLFYGYKTRITFIIHRFKCKNCGTVISDSSTIVPENKNISIRTKFLIMNELQNFISFSDVGKRLNISANTVENVFNDLYEPTISKHLPETLSFDERKNIRTAYGNYMFVMYDPINQRVFDILESRESNIIKDYLYRIDIKERMNVKYVTMDMYRPYKEITKLLFPNAKIIIDRFHYERYMSDCLNNIRIDIQNTFKESDPEYRILKSNWRLILMRKELICNDFTRYNPIERKKTSQYVILDDILNINHKLTEAYNTYQDFLKNMNNVHLEDAKTYMDKLIISLLNHEIEEFHEIGHTFNNWEEEIINSFIRFGDKRLTNGPIEGLNDMIDHIIEASFGYKKFAILRKRIMFIINKDYKFKN